MLLRVSGQTRGHEPDLAEVIAPGVNAEDAGVPHGACLREFALALLEGEESRIASARESLAAALGAAAVVDAAAVVAWFDAINRVADATGTQPDASMEAWVTAALADTAIESLRSS